MEKINGAAIKPEASADTEKEVQLLKIKTEMKAGQILMDEAAKQIERIKERLEREHSPSSRERENGGREAADVSEMRNLSGTGRTTRENPDASWRLEMEAQLWEAFIKWNPVMGAGLSGQLQELSAIYLSLLEAVLKYTIGEEQTAQMARLDGVMQEKLNLLMDSDLKDLVGLLQETGQNDALAGLQASVYRQATGQSISQAEAKRIFGSARFYASPLPPSSSPASKAPGRAVSAKAQASPHAQASSLKEGMIYKSSGKGKIRPSQEFAAQHRQWEAQISQRKQAIRSAANGERHAGGSWGAKNAFTGRELAQANRFASHINGSGDLFKQPGVTAQNGEVLGLLAAITSMKGQVYAREAGQAGSISLPLQNAIDKMIDHYLSQKAASKVYYYTINVYQRTKSPQKAVESGLSYAYEQFKEKQGSPAYQSQPSYGEQAGFFQFLLKGQTPERDFLSGARVLEDNWKEFLRAIGKGNDSALTLKLERQSPWGSFLEPEKKQPAKKPDIGKILLTAAVIFAALAILYFLGQ